MITALTPVVLAHILDYYVTIWRLLLELINLYSIVTMRLEQQVVRSVILERVALDSVTIPGRSYSTPINSRLLDRHINRILFFTLREETIRELFSTLRLPSFTQDTQRFSIPYILEVLRVDHVIP